MRHIVVVDIDGPFVEELKTTEIPFVGSSNQRKIKLR